VILLQVLIGYSGEKRCKKGKNANKTELNVIDQKQKQKTIEGKENTNVKSYETISYITQMMVGKQWVKS